MKDELTKKLLSARILLWTVAGIFLATIVSTVLMLIGQSEMIAYFGGSLTLLYVTAISIFDVWLK